MWLNHHQRPPLSYQTRGRTKVPSLLSQLMTSSLMKWLIYHKMCQLLNAQMQKIQKKSAVQPNDLCVNPRIMSGHSQTNDGAQSCIPVITGYWCSAKQDRSPCLTWLGTVWLFHWFLQHGQQKWAELQVLVARTWLTFFWLSVIDQKAQIWLETAGLRQFSLLIDRSPLRLLFSSTRTLSDV